MVAAKGLNRCTILLTFLMSLYNNILSRPITGTDVITRKY